MLQAAQPPFAAPLLPDSRNLPQQGWRGPGIAPHCFREPFSMHLLDRRKGQTRDTGFQPVSYCWDGKAPASPSRSQETARTENALDTYLRFASCQSTIIARDRLTNRLDEWLTPWLGSWYLRPSSPNRIRVLSHASSGSPRSCSQKDCIRNAWRRHLFFGPAAGEESLPDTIPLT